MSGMADDGDDERNLPLTEHEVEVTASDPCPLALVQDGGTVTNTQSEETSQGDGDNNDTGTAERTNLKLEDVLCPICLDPYLDVVEGSCSHRFCTSCIKHWFRTRGERVCPVCRSRIHSIIPLPNLDDIVNGLALSSMNDLQLRERAVLRRLRRADEACSAAGFLSPFVMSSSATFPRPIAQPDRRQPEISLPQPHSHRETSTFFSSIHGEGGVQEPDLQNNTASTSTASLQQESNRPASPPSDSAARVLELGTIAEQLELNLNQARQAQQRRASAERELNEQIRKLSGVYDQMDRLGVLSSRTPVAVNRENGVLTNTFDPLQMMYQELDGVIGQAINTTSQSTQGRNFMRQSIDLFRSPGSSQEELRYSSFSNENAQGAEGQLWDIDIDIGNTRVRIDHPPRQHQNVADILDDYNYIDWHQPFPHDHYLDQISDLDSPDRYRRRDSAINSTGSRNDMNPFDSSRPSTSLPNMGNFNLSHSSTSSAESANERISEQEHMQMSMTQPPLFNGNDYINVMEGFLGYRPSLEVSGIDRTPVRLFPPRSRRSPATVLSRMHAGRFHDQGLPPDFFNPIQFDHDLHEGSQHSPLPSSLYTDPLNPSQRHFLNPDDSNLSMNPPNPISSENPSSMPSQFLPTYSNSDRSQANQVSERNHRGSNGNRQNNSTAPRSSQNRSRTNFHNQTSHRNGNRVSTHRHLNNHNTSATTNSHAAGFNRLNLPPHRNNNEAAARNADERYAETVEYFEREMQLNMMNNIRSMEEQQREQEYLEQEQEIMDLIIEQEEAEIYGLDRTLSAYNLEDHYHHTHHHHHLHHHDTNPEIFEHEEGEDEYDSLNNVHSSAIYFYHHSEDGISDADGHYHHHISETPAEEQETQV